MRGKAVEIKIGIYLKNASGVTVRYDKSWTTLPEDILLVQGKREIIRESLRRDFNEAVTAMLDKEFPIGGNTNDKT